MKIKNRSHKKTYIITSIIFFIVLASGLTGYAFYTQKHANEEQKTDTKDSTSDGDVKSPNNTTKEDEAPLPSKEESAAPTSNEDTPPTGSTDSPAAAIETPIIERASQSGSNIRVVATLQQNSSGTCEANFTQASATPVKVSAQIVVGPSYYSCSFSIPTTQFQTPGAWSLQVSHIEGNSVSTSAIQTVIIDKG